MTKKTTLKLLAFICLIGISMIWQSCQKEPDLVGKGDVNFNVLSDISKGLKCITCDMNHADKVIITVQYDDGSPTDYTQYQLDIHSMGGTFITKKIALPFGNYKVTEFYIIDALDNIIFASPLDGSVMAQNVENPLPILFSVDEKNISAVDIEVLCAKSLKPEDFGLVQFPVIEVETFQFLISVSELGTDQLLTANITVSSGAYSYQQVLVDNIVTVKDGYDSYIISINKEGYLGFIVTLSNSELKEFAKIPLIVELSLSSTFLDIFHHLDFNDIITTQYGPDAKLNLNGGGKYDWSALVNSITNPLSIAPYLIEKYGSNHIPILVGNHAYDWRYLNTNELSDCVLP
ncbi:MAG: hypothetical protein P1P88_24080, partial [Bacteroidales bacterium]|nr:hypothetical protein [Bacteroidales bacterium]